MAFETIDLTIEGPIATIKLNRPQAMNAFTHVMRDDVCAALDETDADDNVRAVIFTGAGRGFCAGADLSLGAETFNAVSQAKEAGELDDSDPRWRDSGGVMNLRIWASEKPVIAAINGPAVGIGATMLLPMDVRFAVRDTKMAYPFSRRGIAWDGAASWFLPRIVGVPTAMDWALSGRTFKTEEAHEAGLIKALYDSKDELLDAAKAYATELAETTAPVSVAVMRQMAWRMLGPVTPMDAHRIESKAILHAGMSPDAAEGVMSFLEKRPPDFPLKTSTDMPPWYPFWDEEEY
ncbi:enoyl-CoA hydratase-related protein [Hyphobacterium sp. HN65]|uniref:Enoyl-CoA hydratase-related protein n=1 Tax=Hyphobacterium lacteum TaxID=3116575 RepID=A0ABU7LR99_9PROT|nr:enoyl-CoA hydratase-related protein [Hyphobacterium sp. HN65]MEE2526445.1 enoyl-CoA hydratase-related protein [Hyphobacterium sp. HN65]